MVDCWNANPALRPTFAEVLAQLDAMSIEDMDEGDFIDAVRMGENGYYGVAQETLDIILEDGDDDM